MFCKDPSRESHSIVTKDEYGDEVIIPLYLRGVTSLCHVDSIPKKEFDHHEFPRVELTNQHLTWDPSNSVFADQENDMLDHKGEIVRPNGERHPLRVINSVCTSTTVENAVDVFSDENFGQVLSDHVNISSTYCKKPDKTCTVSQFSIHEDNADNDHDDPTMYGNMYSMRKKCVDTATFAERWGLDLRKALNTVNRTIQRGVRACLHPSLARCYPTNDRMPRYKRLSHSVFSDTMTSSVTSRRGNKYAQAYCTKFGWSRIYPMAVKGDAHETLSLMFQRDGVPPRIVVDNSKG